MEKRGQFKNIIILIIILIIVIIAVLASIKFYNKTPEVKTNETELNNELNKTITNASEVNLTAQNYTSENNESPQEIQTTVPNPSGNIVMVDRQNDDGGYFCNYSDKPEHGVRIYTYKILEGIKNLSAEYIESKKFNKICDSYTDINLTEGMNYDLEWRWGATENIDGYRIYQYYSSNTLLRDYNYFVDIKAGRLFDTGLDIWTEDTSKKPQQNST